jgi:excisionase family DNA binding protein
MNSPAEWLTTREVAHLLNVRYEYVSELCRLGKLKAIKRANAWFIDPASVVRYNDGYRKPGPKPNERERYSAP